MEEKAEELEIKQKPEKGKTIKEVILYIVFGVLTTVVNFVVFHLCNKVMNYMVANVIAWVAAVVFAYVTNKLWVFESKSWAPRILAKEIPSFTAARLVTLGIEEAGLLIFIQWCHLDAWLFNVEVAMIEWLHLNSVFAKPPFGGEMLVKIILAVIVVILNYIFSKLIIFKKKADTDK